MSNLNQRHFLGLKAIKWTFFFPLSCCWEEPAALRNTSTFSRIPKGRTPGVLNSFLRGRTWQISPGRGGTLASEFHNQEMTPAAVCRETAVLGGVSEPDGTSRVLALVEM